MSNRLIELNGLKVILSLLKCIQNLCINIFSRIIFVCLIIYQRKKQIKRFFGSTQPICIDPQKITRIACNHTRLGFPVFFRTQIFWLRCYTYIHTYSCCGSFIDLKMSYNLHAVPTHWSISLASQLYNPNFPLFPALYMLLMHS